MLAKYGVENPGQRPEHIERMSKTCGDNTNPFASIQFKLSEYVRGKICLPDDQAEYKKYCADVEKITKKNIQLLPVSDVCYYTGETLSRDPSNYNSWNFATIDHKKSRLFCFRNNIPAEECASPDNLCWCTKYINSVKKELTEDQIITLGYITRYMEIKDILKEQSK